MSVRFRPKVLAHGAGSIPATFGSMVANREISRRRGFEPLAVHMNQYTDRNTCPPRDDLEDHQVWAWMWDTSIPFPSLTASGEEWDHFYKEVNDENRTGRWEICGTGLIL